MSGKYPSSSSSSAVIALASLSSSTSSSSSSNDNHDDEPITATTEGGGASSPAAASDKSIDILQSPSRVFHTPSRSHSFNLYEYIRTEMFGVGEPGHFEPPVKEESIQNFFIVPMKLESLIWLGFIMSLDTFLYVLTFLPIRILFSLFLLWSDIQSYLIKLVTGCHYLSLMSFFSSKEEEKEKGKNGNTSYYPLHYFHRTQGYDIMRGTMFLISCLVLRQINMSQVYHFIRGQSIIKLYVLAGMMEVMDKLLSSFGQDTFDGLHWQTRSNPFSIKMIYFFIASSCYVCLHSILYFFVVATLTVVINSADEALVTVLVINNFSEMRTFVFKKFDGNNLFQIACSDITERFQIFLYLTLICLGTMAQAGSAWKETLPGFLKVAFLMLAGEAIADGMKHAFITKFNSVNASVYHDFAYVLRSDILNNRRDPIILDHTYAVSRRLGMAQLPLGSVFVRYLLQALSAPAVSLYLQKVDSWTYWTWISIIFLSFVLFKLLLGIGLLYYADYAQRKDFTFFKRTPSMEPVKKFPSVGRKISNNNKVIAGKNSSALGAFSTDDDHHEKRKGKELLGMKAISNSASKELVTLSTNSQVVVSSNSSSGNNDMDEERIKERIRFVEKLAEMDRYSVYNGKIV